MRNVLKDKTYAFALRIVKAYQVTYLGAQRVFEMENIPFDVQLEFLEFEKLTDDTGKLKIRTVFKSVALRDQLLQLPFARRLNMAHNRLQEIVSKLR
jgi:hypothetical protein